MKSDTKCTAVMLAAGMGLRMGGEIRKQYLMLGGMPMFLHSIRTMQESPIITDIVVTVHKDDVEMYLYTTARDLFWTSRHWNASLIQYRGPEPALRACRPRTLSR